MPIPVAKPVDPVIGQCFAIEFDGMIKGYFNECSGVGGEVKVEPYEEGGHNDTTRKFPGRASFGNITLKRGVTLDTEMLVWFLDVARGRKSRKTVTVILYDQDGSPALRWNLEKAFPVKYSASSLQATANQVNVETIEFAHEGINL